MGSLDVEKPLILIVEDEFLLRVVLEDIFAEEGFGVMAVENGKEGLERLFQNAPDLIVLDLFMPDMDGFDFLQELEYTVGKPCPIIVYSGHIEQEYRDKCHALGADYFVTKQVDYQELLRIARDVAKSRGYDI